MSQVLCQENARKNCWQWNYGTDQVSRSWKTGIFSQGEQTRKDRKSGSKLKWNSPSKCCEWEQGGASLYNGASSEPCQMRHCYPPPGSLPAGNHPQTNTARFQLSCQTGEKVLTPSSVKIALISRENKTEVNLGDKILPNLPAALLLQSRFGGPPENPVL